MLLLLSGSSWMKSLSLRLLAPDLMASLRAREGSEFGWKTQNKLILYLHWRAWEQGAKNRNLINLENTHHPVLSQTF